MSTSLMKKLSSNNMQFILGSASPRRRSIFEMFFPEFKIVSPDIIEVAKKNEVPEDFAKRMSLEKLEAVLSETGYHSSMFAASADTIIALGNTIIGKPQDLDDAIRIISSLSGRTHQVITGLTLYLQQGEEDGRFLTNHEVSFVTFKKLSESEIRHYLSLIEYLDKSGSYAIQQHGDLIIEGISGSRSNIIGFPIGLFFRMLNSLGCVELLV